ncbi:PilZ domain-containing protein [Cohnella endophytica]|uniref:PilZ domain-containing protein n=1 Tax=Cohnella endophytica TaxID=2419778 RepID=A0A494XYM5_9BACL|nr:PilZ domain-containing protein [Cohnella endophytica]RKP53179.1 PilZ domain-containing protein [Cohnella endophytica]
MEEEKEDNRRESVRFGFNVPLFAELSLRSVNGSEVGSRSQRVMLNNVGMGGCCFVTFLQLPVREDVEWFLKMRLGNYSLSLRGIIVYRNEVEGYQSYGAKWVLTGLERQALQYRLNEYVRNVLVSSPHIHTLYKKLSARNDDSEFRHLDVSS